MSKSDFYGPFFKVCHWIVRLFKKPYSTTEWEKQKGPVVYISHHQNMFGPFTTLLSSPIDLHCWVLHVFLDKQACFEHYRTYTFRERFGWPSWLANTAAFFVSRFVPTLLNSGQALPVYRGRREVLQTFKKSVDVLKRKESIVIFPNKDYEDTSNEVGELYEGFLFLEKYFYRETGKHLTFVPLYANQRKRKMITGKPIQFQSEKGFKEERKVVIRKIQEELNQLA